MTQEEFYERFTNEVLVIEHHSRAEWTEIYDYLIQQNGLLYNGTVNSHNWELFPYTKYNKSAERVDNSKSPMPHHTVISFEVFAEIISGCPEDIAQDCHLEDIL